MKPKNYVKKGFAANFTTTNWVKPAQPGELIVLTPTLLMGSCGRCNVKESSPTRLPVREAQTVYLNNSITYRITVT